ncbi:alpha/beta hydrolase [Rhodococcus sp. Z13]|uniref:Alpha/beta hydrolase n=1 Tax=Rhodococcus sacchari TaxID=2962047 RepID=A0ACD4DCE0_9NOCA|nr:alpha/beta hydrolase [Rhodococcus sp. Z13]UYP17635.1 alpha/beta hydrolase [Rhodococcus sp. Z13]
MRMFVIVLAAVVSLFPSLLPRDPVVQGVVTGVLIVFALASRRIVVSVFHRRTGRFPSPTPDELRWPIVTVGASAMLVAVAGAHRWQNRLRQAMDVPGVDLRYWTEVVLVAAVVVTVLVGGTRAVVAALRTGTSPGRAGRLPVVAVVTVLACLGAGTVSASPTDPAPSSGVDLGREGRRFVSLPSDGSALRVYIPLAAAADPEGRAERAVAELDRVGGWDREHLVVAVPTGSGWVDAAAVRGFESRWGDDLVIVAQQYSDRPSWATFVLDRDAAVEETRALVAAVRTRLAALPTERRPVLHLYGQSLGATGASAVFANVDPEPCALFLAGPPAGVRTDGATVRANSSDPVVWWQPALLWSPPDLSRARIDAPVPPWLPVLTFVQTSVDLLVSLDAPIGHGHRYGEDQARCAAEDR